MRSKRGSSLATTTQTCTPTTRYNGAARYRHTISCLRAPIYSSLVHSPCCSGGIFEGGARLVPIQHAAGKIADA